MISGFFRFMIIFSSSRSPQAVLKKQLFYLKRGVIDPSLHYHSLKQSKAWEKVFQRHCPVLSEPSFSQIYRTLFSRFTIPSGQRTHLIGLGCGTGVKEQWLAQCVKRGGFSFQRFTAVDVSERLCQLSLKRLRPFVLQKPKGWVIDLDAAKELRCSLDQGDRTERRIYTLFGLVPNLDPSLVLRILKTLLRSGDQLFMSANLAPVKNKEESEVERAVKRILPQYQNRETREWLSLLFEEQKITKKMISALRFGIESEQGLRSVIVRGEVLQDFEWILGGRRVRMKKRDSLKVFQSRRWTSFAFEHWMKRAGFKVRACEITPNGEEGVWWVER